MSAIDTYDRYVTFGIFFPDGQPGFLPTLDQWSLPVWFPDPGDFFPKTAQPTYAIRNTVGATTVLDPQGGAVSIPSGGWWIYYYGQHQYVGDLYFFGGAPDLSGGTQYPAAALTSLPVNPPQWVIDGTDPTQPPVVDPGTTPTQPPPLDGGITPPSDDPGTDPANPAPQGVSAPSDAATEDAPATDAVPTDPAPEETA